MSFKNKSTNSSLFTIRNKNVPLFTEFKAINKKKITNLVVKFYKLFTDFKNQILIFKFF